MATSNAAAQPKLSKGLKITLIAVVVGAALYAVLVLRPMLAGPAESAESAPTTTTERSDADRRPSPTTTKGSSSSSAGKSDDDGGAAQSDVVVPNRGLDLPPELAALPERNPMRPG